MDVSCLVEIAYLNTLLLGDLLRFELKAVARGVGRPGARADDDARGGHEGSQVWSESPAVIKYSR